MALANAQLDVFIFGAADLEIIAPPDSNFKHVSPHLTSLSCLLFDKHPAESPG
jgi:hypothetical protein